MTFATLRIQNSIIDKQKSVQEKEHYRDVIANRPIENYAIKTVPAMKQSGHAIPDCYY